MTTEEEEEQEKGEDVFGEMALMKKKPPRLARMRSPSFEGYFASQSGAIALQAGNAILKSNPVKIGEIQEHLEHMVSLMREEDALRMAVRVESQNPERKRYLTVVSSQLGHSAIIGIDWTTGEGPTIGLVLPIWSTTVVKLNGDSGFHVSRTSTLNHIMKPVSVQTLWSALQVIDKAVNFASKHKYFEGVNTNGFLGYYTGIIGSSRESIAEWNELDDLSSHVMGKVNLPPDPDEEEERIKNSIQEKLREVMRNLDLDTVTTRDIRQMCEKDMDMSLVKYKRFLDEQVLVVMGQMDSASEILDYLYLGSEWNATDLVWMKEMGIGYILNITREVDNFFPCNMFYYNIRVYDEESTELLNHWDHTYRFIEKARESESKVLVHCRHGISRSASTVIAYLMKKKGWSMSNTLEYVQDIRPIVQPNPGFTKQLIIYEGILNSSRNRFSSLFRDRASSKLGDDGEVQGKEDSSNNRMIHSQSSLATIDQNENEDGKENKKYGGVDSGGGGGGGGGGGEEERRDDSCEMEANVRQSSFDAEDVVDVDDTETDCAKTLWHSPAPLRKLRRAKTMLSGAVFIDNEDESEVDSTKSTNEDTGNGGAQDSANLSDAEEDAVMEQVVMARDMKTELMASVKKLHDDTESFDDFDGNDTLEENNIKPSDLRRLSYDSQLLHFKNIASMKKRKSLTEQEMAKESLLEIVEDVPIECELALENNKVSELSEIFARRSKSHVRDNTRRRTLDDESLLSGGKFEIPDGMEIITTSEQLETPEQPVLKCDLPEKTTEKVFHKPDAQPLPGNLSRSATWTSGNLKDLQQKVFKEKCESNTDFKSIKALNLEIQELSRTFDDGTTERPSNDGTGDGEKEETLDEFRVADLVHLHDKMIREKSSGHPSSSTSLPPCDDPLFKFDLLKDDDDETTSNNLKRVQSFPKRKKKLSLACDNAKSDLRSGDVSRSVPSSPIIFMNPDDINGGENSNLSVKTSNKDNTNAKSDGNSPQQQALLPDVKRIVSKYETRQRSIDVDDEDDRKRSLSVGDRGKTTATTTTSGNTSDAVRRRSSSTICDLRSFDEKQAKMSQKKT